MARCPANDQAGHAGRDARGPAREARRCRSADRLHVLPRRRRRPDPSRRMAAAAVTTCWWRRGRPAVRDPPTISALRRWCQAPVNRTASRRRWGRSARARRTSRAHRAERPGKHPAGRGKRGVSTRAVDGAQVSVTLEKAAGSVVQLVGKRLIVISGFPNQTAGSRQRQRLHACRLVTVEGNVPAGRAAGTGVSATVGGVKAETPGHGLDHTVKRAAEDAEGRVLAAADRLFCNGDYKTDGCSTRPRAGIGRRTRACCPARELLDISILNVGQGYLRTSPAKRA